MRPPQFVQSTGKTASTSNPPTKKSTAKTKPSRRRCHHHHLPNHMTATASPPPVRLSLMAALVAIIFYLQLPITSGLPGNDGGFAAAKRMTRNGHQKFTVINNKDAVEQSLVTIHDITNENLGSLCVTKAFRPLTIALNTARYEGARQKVDLAAAVLAEVGVNRHGALLDALAKGLLLDEFVSAARILASNTSTGILGTSVWWAKNVGSLDVPRRIVEDGVQVGSMPSAHYPWYEDEFSSPSLRSPKFVNSPESLSFRGVWTYPYFSCALRRYVVSYSVPIVPVQARKDVRGYLSVDIDVSDLQVNQCNADAIDAGHDGDAVDMADRNSGGSTTPLLFASLMQQQQQQQHHQQQQPTSMSPQTILSSLVASSSAAAAAFSDFQLAARRTRRTISHEAATSNQVEAFHGSHKCHATSMQCIYRPPTSADRIAAGASAAATLSWARGAYRCACRPGFYSTRHPDGFNGTTMEVVYQEFRENLSNFYETAFVCLECAPGCTECVDARPCLASYNWPFRLTLLSISALCAAFTLSMAGYLYKHRKVKVFKVASPIFLSITLLGCATMYMEMGAIFPFLDRYACIATKWTRHMGFCLTYTALLMKTWRVSLTYRVKSAHKVKLTDKQLLQWMVPILLVMLIYLSTWTLSAPPYAEVIVDKHGLKFMQCSYNWWDHSMAIGEALFLAWGIRVCYNVRNAESLYNEARCISYAIYNIALVNILMIAFHLCIFPQAGPDIKYLLGFIRTQLSTSVTVALVFGPKVARVMRGQGDQWDHRARARGFHATFSMNGGGLMQEDSPDPYLENEELKEEVQKLASQIEFMKIVHMEINNRHLKPKPGGHFTMVSVFQSPMYKGTSAQTQTSKHSTQQNSGVSEDGLSGTHSVGANSLGFLSTVMHPPSSPGTSATAAATTAYATDAAPANSNGTERV